MISYSYLQITQGLRADLARPPPTRTVVKDRRWMTYVITDFSNMYFGGVSPTTTRGRPVADAWRITFETAASGDANAGQDVLLFSNAHVQHDLPFGYEQMGLRARDGKSHKPDHDAVNAINARVFDPIENYIAAHYDPTFSADRRDAVALDEIGTLELVKSWREGAWRNAERLANAATAEEQAEVVRSIHEQLDAVGGADLLGSDAGPARDSRLLVPRAPERSLTSACKGLRFGYARERGRRRVG